MTSRKKLNTDLTRRHWMVLATSALTGCGGGGGGVSIAGAPGTGGTGIYQGSITGFGSVIVNGVTYDNSKAVMRLNDVVVPQDTLRLGMVATVRGDRVAGATLGTASRIDVWSIAQGQVSEAGDGHFTVAGMTIQTSATTWFYGFTTNVSPLNGDYVSVWGLQKDAEGKTWTASCVEMSRAAADAVSSGLVKVEDGKRTLNELDLIGDVANGLAEDVLVRVQGTWLPDGSLTVASSQSIDNAVVASSQDEVEIEGLVTTTPTATGFMLGSITVDASPSLYSPLGAAITVGSRVEVYGSWQSGVLKASKVELEDASTQSSVEIKAPLQDGSVDWENFLLQGQLCNAVAVPSNQRPSTVLPADGTILKVKGNKNGAWLMVSAVERGD